ncbi:MAG: TlpA family protein disulfide reductase [Gracilimonas sp.]|uniref:TlpA family protein disulfide reductase n=1 Tax=Gracilimonas sp. TaxID=1974203 RepID=UPI00374FF5FB|nr:TlpA family protein disulfide reductase [Gracilimonas sp.]
MWRVLLWAGLFNAEGTEVAEALCPMLSEQAYHLVLNTPEGEQLRLEQFKDNALFINIQAFWCPLCVVEMPTIQKLHVDVSKNDNIRFLMISLDENQEKARKFMEGKDFSIPYYFPVSGLPKIFQSPYIPSTFVISKERQVVYKQEISPITVLKKSVSG